MISEKRLSQTDVRGSLLSVSIAELQIDELKEVLPFSMQFQKQIKGIKHFTFNKHPVEGRKVEEVG